jgi:hypothetical protein
MHIIAGVPIRAARATVEAPVLLLSQHLREQNAH